MRSDLIVTFPGGKKVDAGYKGFTIRTDQPVAAGGEGSAPSPFDLFLASIGACGGIYMLDFLQSRGIPLEGARLVQTMERDDQTRMVTKIEMRLEVPKDFPDKYRDALIKAVELCTVKRHIASPPAFAIETVKAG